MKSRKEKANSQLSLSQSLLRKKTRNIDSSSNKLNATDGDQADFQGCDDKSLLGKTTKSYSQPENDDFDDSFDLFIPRKSPKKCHAPKAPSSQSSFFEVKKGKKSRYFDKNGQLQVPQVIKDDDLELAIAVSLQESKGGSVNLKPPKAARAPIPRGKLKKACSQSLLMRRSAADRERIITEKVAIILMDTNKIESPSSSLNHREPRLLYSAFLNEKFNTLKTLWSLSQNDLIKIPLVRFYTNVLISYLSSPLQDGAGAHPDASDMDQQSKESGDLHLAVSDDDMFGSSGDESSKEPSPKRPRRCSPQEDDGSSSNQLERRLEGESHQMTVTPSDQSAGSATNLSSVVNKDTSFEGLSLRVDASDLIAADNSGSPAESVDFDVETPLKATTYVTPDGNKARRSLSTSFTENNENVNRHHRKLSADLLSLSVSSVSKIIEIRKGTETLYVHGCAFKARCPKLFDELMTNSNCLDDIALEVCQALFAYIYGGNVGKAQILGLAEKSQLAECCLRFGLEELAEELFPKGEENDFSSLADGPGKEETEGAEHAFDKKENRPSEPEKELINVVVLDSDCCSTDELLNTKDASEDELDSFLKGGIRIFETSSTSLERDVGEGGSKEAKRSIEKYFQDSFPSLDGLSVTPTPHQAKGSTPGSSRGITNCVTPGGQLVVSELATPVPDYESMVSPDLKEALQNYGIKRGIGRRKAVTLLRYIYDQIHPPSDHPAVAKAIDDIKCKPQSALPARDSDCDVYSLSSESSGDEMFEDLGDVYHAQDQPNSQETASKPGLLREVGNFIKSNSLLYAAVLKYEPIWLNKFHQTLKETGIKCNENQLMEVLDELGVTFRKAPSQRRKTKKPTRRK